MTDPIQTHEASTVTATGTTSVFIVESPHTVGSEPGDPVVLSLDEAQRHLAAIGVRFERHPNGAHAGVVVYTEGARVRINGLRVPRLSVVQVGDSIRIGDGQLYHLTTYEDNAPVVPSGVLLDRACATCKAPLAEDTRVRICRCGEPRHAEGEEVAADERRDCWQLGACPSCGAPPREEPGYVFWPEGLTAPSGRPS